jgi:hypothetical protein
MNLNLRKLLYTIVLLLKVPLIAQGSPFYSQVEMPGGPLAGQPLNTQNIRGIFFLNGTIHQIPNANEAKYGYIANFHHDGKFYVARVPYDSIKNVDFIYEKFTNMVGGHADLVYQLDPKKPVELLYEIKDSDSSRGYELVELKEPIRLSELVYSAEAVKVTGDKSGLAEGGMSLKFAIAYRLTSVRERLVEPVLGEGRKTTAVNVGFDEFKAQKSFWNSVTKYHSLGMSTNYHLITNNCITSAVTALSLGLSATERQYVEARLQSVTYNINELGISKLSDAKIKQILAENLSIFNQYGRNMSMQSILNKPYFVNSLTPSEQSTMCKATF